MKKTHFTPVLLVLASLLGGCGSMPRTTSLLDQTRSEYSAAQNNPQVANHAALEMQQASEAMARANAAANDNESAGQIDKLAYLARQKIALTQEVSKQKSAEAEVASAGKERDQMRLAQRTNEADRANAAKRVAQESAVSAQRDTAAAQRDTAAAQRQTQEAEARAAQMEAQLAELSAKKTERGMVITLGDVLFQTDQDRLNPEGLRTAQKLAEVLQQNPQRTVLVEGFTDSTGSAAHNQKLSERRALSVRRSLEDQGVGRNRIAVQGFGEAYPVAGNESSEDRQLNRRVEIVISNDEGAIRRR